MQFDLNIPCVLSHGTLDYKYVSVEGVHETSFEVHFQVGICNY